LRAEIDPGVGAFLCRRETNHDLSAMTALHDMTAIELGISALDRWMTGLLSIIESLEFS